MHDKSGAAAPNFISLRRRSAVAAGIAVALLCASVAPVTAHYAPVSRVATASPAPTAERKAPKTETKPTRERRHRAADRRSSRRAARVRLEVPRGSIGYDISFPQCHGRFPRNADFRIVGVNHGRAFTVNRCLGAGHGPSELRWAGLHAWLYANTGSPGPKLSKRWPLGQQGPRACTRAHPLSLGCAYDYGWNAARHSYNTAVRAYVSLGWAKRGATRTPVRNRWWLDVESSNSWRGDERLNAATLRGAVAFLESRNVASVGFYSAKFMWAHITGKTRAFADYPTWVAGASTLRAAKRYCGGAGFTRGGVELSQFPKNGYDANFAC